MSLYEIERAGDVQELIRVIRESDNQRVRARANHADEFLDVACAF
jgi:hypothetical protein